MSFVRLALTQSATLLGLTPAIVGFALARSLGVSTALTSMLLACAITCVLATGSALLAVAYRKPTAFLSGILLGPQGPRLVGLALAISAMGFFGVHMMALLQALPALWPHASWTWPHAPIVIASAIGSVALVYRGNANIAGINGVQAPLLVLAVAWAARSRGGPPLATTSPLWSPSHVDWPSVAMVVAAGLGDVVDLPSVMHRARTRLDAVIAVWLTYGVVLPALLWAGTWLGRDMQADSALSALADGSGPWRVGVCLLAISCATVGNANLVYSGSLSVAAACQQPPGPRHRLWLGVAAALVSLTPLTQQLPPLLDGLGLTTGAVGTGLLTHFVLDGGRPISQAGGARAGLAAWACGLGALFGALALAVGPQGAPGAAVAVASGSSLVLTCLARMLPARRTGA